MRLTIKFPHTETTKTEKKKFSAFERVGGTIKNYNITLVMLYQESQS
jgi:hypothetical protein